MMMFRERMCVREMPQMSDEEHLVDGDFFGCEVREK